MKYKEAIIIIPFNKKFKDIFIEMAGIICRRAEVHCIIFPDIWPLETKFIGNTANQTALVSLGNPELLQEGGWYNGIITWKNKKI